MRVLYLGIIAFLSCIFFLFSTQDRVLADNSNDIYHLVPLEQDKKPFLNFTTDGAVDTVDVSSNGRYVTAGTQAGDKEGLVYFFDKNGTPLWNYTADRQILQVAISSDGKYLAAAGSQFYHYGTHGPAGWNNGEVYYFDASGNLLWKYNGTGSVAVTSIAVSSDGSHVAVGSDKSILYFDREGNLLWSHKVDRSNDHTVSISPDGSHVATKDEAVVEFLDNHGNLLWSYTAGHGTQENTSAGSLYITMSPDGRYIITSDYIDGILVFDDSGKIKLAKSTGEHFYYESMSYDGSFIAASAQQWGESDPGATYLYDKNGTLLWSYPGEIRAKVSGNGLFVLGGIEHNGGPTLFFLDKKGNMLWNSNARDVDSLAVSYDGALSVAGTGFENTGGSILFFNQENTGGTAVPQPAIPPFRQNIVPPLKQFQSGVAAKDVHCSDELILVIKTEDGSPACVKPDTAQKLIERGWAKEIASSSMDESHNLKLSFSTNSSSIQSGHAIGIGISLNNTASGSFSLKDQDHWPIDGMSLGSCSNLPIGISILRGYYTLQNMSGASSLWLYPNLPCPSPVGTTGYTFQPMSNVATRECSLPFSCHDSITIEGSLAISSYLTGNGIETSFQNGNYTIVGGDEWGDVIIRHFTVVNSTSVPVVNPTSQIIPSCASNIPHQSVFAGYAGSLSCPAMQYYMNSKILNFSGFVGVYHTISDSSVVGPSTYTNPLQEQIDKDGNDRMEANLVLEPGYNGTITYQLTLHVGRCAGSCPPGITFPTVVNQTNIGEFIHRQGNEMLHSHDGLDVTYEPQSESMQDNQTVTLKATVTASKDVPPGTYWLVLTPGNCVGGPLVLITVSDCKK
ncbi:MAG: PQQ-like beta-propeller repeat protein [Thaumarchaeota archaeon]|nr:PQQ-like beta-propeller repeat protein [Nitrososphaerota archaeon]